MWYSPSKHLQSFQFDVIRSFHGYSFSPVIWVLIKKYWLELGPRQTFDLKSNFSLIVCKFLNVFFNYSNSLLLSSSVVVALCEYFLALPPVSKTSILFSFIFTLILLRFLLDFKQPVEVGHRYVGLVVTLCCGFFGGWRLCLFKMG